MNSDLPARSADSYPTEDLAELRRTLWTLYEFNHALIRTTDERALLESVCRILVDVGGMRMAWVGYKEDDEAKTIRPVAQAGDEEGYVSQVKGTWADVERGRGPAGTAIRTQRPAWIDSVASDASMTVWRTAALARGYHSILALPLVSGEVTLGMLALYVAKAQHFDEGSVARHLEMANHLADAVVSLRARAERRRAGRETERNVAYLAEAQRLSHAGHWVRHLNDEEPGYWSQELLRIFGFDPATPWVSFTSFLERVHPADREIFQRTLHEAMRDQREFQANYRIMLPSGTIKYIHSAGHPILDAAGGLTHFIGTAIDVTGNRTTDEAARETLAKLARVGALSEVIASIGREVDEPLSIVAEQAEACHRALSSDPPNLEEARQAIQRIARNAARTKEALARIRAHCEEHS